MAYIIDIILIVIFAAVILGSYKKGFFKSLFDLIGSLVAFALARVFSEQLAAEFYVKFIQEPARSTLTNNLGAVGTTDYGMQVEEAINSIPDSFSGVMNMIGINKQELLDQVASSKLSDGTLIDNLMNNVVEPVGTAIVQFVLFIVLAIVLVIAIKIAVKLLDFIIKKIPVVKQLNKSLGIVVGVLRGFIAVIIISMVFSMVAGFAGADGFAELVANSQIVSMSQDIIASFSGAVIN